MRQPPPVPQLLNQLAAFGERMAPLLDEPAVDWRWRPSPGDWNLTQLMCHLRDVEREVHQPRFQALIERDNVFLPGVSADSWAEPRAYHRQDGRRALADFVAARRGTVEMLTGVDETMWDRHGRHAFFGNTTMHELLNLVVGHDRAHGEQIGRLLAAD